jgi:hypothetical protein
MLSNDWDVALPLIAASFLVAGLVCLGPTALSVANTVASPDDWQVRYCNPGRATLSMATQICDKIAKYKSSLACQAGTFANWSTWNVVGRLPTIRLRDEQGRVFVCPCVDEKTVLDFRIKRG